MMHQSVKHSLGHAEALKHSHGVTDVRIDGSGSQSPSLDQSRQSRVDQVSTQHHCQHTACPLFQLHPRFLSSTSSFHNAAVHTAPLTSPGYNRTPNPCPIPYLPLMAGRVPNGLGGFGGNPIPGALRARAMVMCAAPAMVVCAAPAGTCAWRKTTMRTSGNNLSTALRCYSIRRMPHSAPADRNQSDS